MVKDISCSTVLHDENSNESRLCLQLGNNEIGCVYYRINNLNGHRFLVINNVDLASDFNCLGIFKIMISELSAINSVNCDCKSIIFFSWKKWNKRKRPEWFLDALEYYGVSILDFGNSDYNESVILSLMVNEHEETINVD